MRGVSGEVELFVVPTGGPMRRVIFVKLAIAFLGLMIWFMRVLDLFTPGKPPDDDQ